MALFLLKILILLGSVGVCKVVNALGNYRNGFVEPAFLSQVQGGWGGGQTAPVPFAKLSP